MTTVHRIDGAPGTGKTYTLRQQLERRKAGGLEPDSVYWITFTRAGTEDAVETVRDVFPSVGGGDGVNPDDLARTFHSLTLSLLLREQVVEFEEDQEPDPVIVQGDYDEHDIDPFRQFCDAYALPYDADANDTKKLLSGERQEAKTGNTFFAIHDFLNQTCKPAHHHYDAPLETTIPSTRLEDLLKEWDRWKQTQYEHRVYQFADYVNVAYENDVVPDVDLLLIDEFQDFTPAEYRLYKSWRDSGEIDEIAIAGDPEQSIYSFRGGSPLYFRETDRDEDINLTESYRCPESIADAAVQILDAHPDTSPRGFTGRAADGSLRAQTIRNGESLADSALKSARRVDENDDRPTLMFLTRTNSQLRGVSTALLSAGIPFDLLGSQSSLWAYGTLADMLDFLDNFREATAYYTPRVEIVMSNLPTAAVGDLDKSSNLGQTIPADAVHDAFGEFATAAEIVQKLQLPDWKTDALAAAIDRPADLSPDDVRIGTIHTSKGLEASSVYLFAEGTNNITERYERDEDAAAEEHRVYYVGTTRAAEELTIVENYFDGPTAPPIEWLRLSGVIA